MINLRDFKKTETFVKKLYYKNPFLYNKLKSEMLLFYNDVHDTQLPLSQICKDYRQSSNKTSLFNIYKILP